MDIKRIGIIAAIVVVSTLFWVVANGWMHADTRFESWGIIVLSGALLTLASASIALGFLLLSRGQWAAYSIGGVLVSYLVIFGISGLTLLGAALGAVAWWTSAHFISRELRERRSIRVSSVLSHGLPRLLFGFYILLSFAFYLTPASQGITQKNATDAFQAQVDATTDVVLQSELNKLPASQREEVKRQISSSAVKTFGNILSFKLCFSETACTPTMLQLLPPLYAFVFFITIWGFGFIFRELAIAVGAGLFLVLKGFRLVSIDQVDAKVDVLKI